MRKISINDFQGGMAEDIRELRSDTYATARGWNIVSSSVKMTNYRGTDTETSNSIGTLANVKLTDILAYNDTTGDTLASSGNVDGSTNEVKFAIKNSMATTDPFLNYTNSGNTYGDTGAVCYNTLAAYKGKLFAMFRDSNSQGKVRMYDRPSATATALGSIASAQTSYYVGNQFGVKPFVHSQSNIVYFANGSIVAQYDGTTYTAAAFTVASDLHITSLSEYGAYLAIACEPRVMGGRSKVYLWNLDTGNTRAQEILDFGEGMIRVLENINGELIGLSVNNTTSSLTLNAEITMRVYNGGSPQIVRRVLSDTSSNCTLYPHKIKKNNALYFSARISVNGTDTHQLWACGKNKKGNYFITPDQYVTAPATAVVSIYGVGAVGDYFWFGLRDNGADGKFVKTSINVSYIDATYDSLINHKMSLTDRPLAKKLRGIYLTSPSGGVFTVSYSVDGSAFTQIFTGTLAANTTREITAFDDGSHFKDGKEYQFRIVATGNTNNGVFISLSEWGYWYDITKTQIPAQ